MMGIVFVRWIIQSRRVVIESTFGWLNIQSSRNKKSEVEFVLLVRQSLSVLFL